VNKNVSNVERVLIIRNPASGQGDPEALRETLEQHLKQKRVTYEIRDTKGEGDALKWAQEAKDVDLVIASGGDGTIMEAMSGLIKNDQSIPLAQLPAGTANLLARAFGIPTDPVEALNVALSGVAVSTDVGYLPDHDRYFALVAGAGWHAQLVEDASRDLKNKLGVFAYVVTGIKNLFDLQHSKIDLEIDGKHHRYRANTVMIINIGEIVGVDLKMGQNISAHDGKLDLSIASPRTLFEVLRLTFRMLTKQYDSYNDLKYFSASSIRVTATPPLEVQIDGESIGQTPLYAEAVPDGALLIVPEVYAKDKGLTDMRGPA
jgi:diacylglycerol kinase (ATP)